MKVKATVTMTAEYEIDYDPDEGVHTNDEILAREKKELINDPAYLLEFPDVKIDAKVEK